MIYIHHETMPEVRYIKFMTTTPIARQSCIMYWSLKSMQNSAYKYNRFKSFDARSAKRSILLYVQMGHDFI